MRKRHKKMFGILVSFIIFVSNISASAAEIVSVNIDEGKIVSAEISGDAAGTLYAAVYEGGVLTGYDTASVSGSGTAVFKNGITYDEYQALKCFLWDDNMQPLSEPYIKEASVSAFAASFDKDEHISIEVSDTQDFDKVTLNPYKAYARDGDTGEILSDGNGQINFRVIADEGYEVSEVSAEPADSFKNFKVISETENIYRITKITGDVTVTVSSKEKSASESGDGIIHLNGSSINADGIEGASVSGTTLTLTQAGEYAIEGTLDDGQIAVSLESSDDEAVINLNSVDLSSSAGDAFSASKGKVTLAAASGTENIFKASGADSRGIYSKNDLTIKGEGKLTAVSEYDNGIQCKKDIEIGAGDLFVEAANNGIKGDKSVKITKKNDSVTVIAGKDGIKSDLAPSTDSDTGEYVSGGIVTINGGSIDITAESDGIQADSLLEINGGTLNIISGGEAIKADASSIAYLEDSTVEQTPAEGDGCINITGGTITASAGEDGIKAVKKITIEGGDIAINEALEGMQVNEAVYEDDGETIKDYVEGKIEITGGSLDIKCSEDGIQCGTGSISITDGEISVDSVQDCIQAEYIMDISGGTFSLKANGGVPSEYLETDFSCKGIKGGSLVNISGGIFSLNTYDDAIHSNNTARISGGKITAASGDDGIHADSYLYVSDDADINITSSYEGIEAAEIYVQGGETRIVASDDGVNAAGDKPAEDSAQTLSDIIEILAMPVWNMPENNQSWNKGPNWDEEDSSDYGYLEISDGLIYVEAEGDGLDSNGNALISGGTVLVNGPTGGGNGVFDVGDNSSLVITGGTVIGTGTSDMAVTPNSAADSQYYISGSFNSSQQAGKAFRLTDSNNDEIITYVPSKSYSWILISTPNITDGSYKLSYGGSVSDATYIGKDSCGIAVGGSYSGTGSANVTSKK